MTYGEVLMIQAAKAAFHNDGGARRDIKEWAEGKTPEAKPEIDDSPNEDAIDLEQPERFPDEDERPPRLYLTRS
jgi:hypothetical protein